MKIRKKNMVFLHPSKKKYLEGNFSFREENVVFFFFPSKPKQSKQTSDGIVTISSWRRCGGVGSEIGSRFAVEVVAVVVFVLANVLRFVVIVVDDAARLLTARSSRRETRFDRGRVLAQRRAGSEARRRMLVVVDRLQRRRDSCRCRFRTFTTHHQIGPRIDTATHH